MNLHSKDGIIAHTAWKNLAAVGIFLETLCLSAAHRTRAPEDIAWFQSTMSGFTLSRGVLLARINEVRSLSRLAEMRKIYIERVG